jgi:signal transduction histidine kinase/ActR/RegA family two-component response regulator
MINYDIRNDLADQRQNYLQYLLFITAFLALLVFAISAVTSSVSVPVWAVLAPSLFISNLLRKKTSHLSQAAWLYLVGLVAAIGIAMFENGSSSALYFLMLVPIAVSTLIIDHENVLWLAGIITCLMYGLALRHADWLSAIGLIAAPAAVSFVVAIILYLKDINVLDMVHWATDIQRKANTRAEMYFEQKEQLSDALLQLTHAKSRLELMNDKLEEANHKAEEASQAKSIFLSNMSHELRTPLNVIIGYTSTMLDMPAMYNDVTLPGNYRSDVQLVKDNGYYLLGLINDILDLSKIEAGKLELHCTAVDLPEIFRGIMATSIGLVKDKPIQVRPEFPDILPKVWADPIRVRQIILNLMSNAVKFTPTGSVTLQAYVADQEVHIAVIDTGIGIPEKALEHIFDRFEQAERDTDRHYGGTGLGLDISKQLARMHESDLKVESVVGQGSTFYFTLHLATQEQIASLEMPKAFTTEASQSIRAFTAQAPSGYAATILLAEDESSLREMLRRSLESVGHVIVDVQDGAQVLEMAVGLLPELIILDIRLPNIDGWQILESLKRNPETAPIPVIVCTVSEDEQRAIGLGADIYIRKPFSTDEVLACVQELLPASIPTDKEL